MERKRRNTSSAEPDSPPPKRSRQATEDSYEDSDEEDEVPQEQPRIDTTYGQKGAFPGLEFDGDELFYGPANDGIEYLRMVRSEARGVPRLLVAPHIGPQKPTIEDSIGGFFDDDAYIAAPKSEPVQPSALGSDAQDEYYRSLLLRFDLIRATLKCPPPLESISSLPSSRPISFPPDNKKARKAWQKLLRTTDPSMVQLACMDMPSILGVIGLLGEALSEVAKRQDSSQMKHVGTWIWGSLGRCHEVGQLGSEEVSELRDLGKQAVAILVAVRDGLDVSTVYGNDGNPDAGSEDGGEEGERTPLQAAASNADRDISQQSSSPRTAVDELEQARERLRMSLARQLDSDTGPSDPVGGKGVNFPTQLRVAVDMIITVVGEKYGQRDLLEFRDIWEESDD